MDYDLAGVYLATIWDKTECMACRKLGTKRMYIGETSRSPYQHGKEHNKEVKEGMLDHPMVQHFWEDYGGMEQEIMFRVLGRHIKALDRQVHESVLIEKISETVSECLNLKSEWAGSKIPGLRDSNPKGLVCNKEGGEEEEGTGSEASREVFREAVRKDSL